MLISQFCHLHNALILTVFRTLDSTEKMFVTCPTIYQTKVRKNFFRFSRKCRKSVKSGHYRGGPNRNEQYVYHLLYTIKNFPMTAANKIEHHVL